MKKSKEEAKRETFGFKSKHRPCQLRELENFEKDLFNVVASLKFRKLNDSFEEKILGNQTITEFVYICRQNQ